MPWSKETPYRVNLIESERGWGQRLDEVLYFETSTLAEQYVAEFNSKNTATVVPDWYMYAEYVGLERRS